MDRVPCGVSKHAGRRGHQEPPVSERCQHAPRQMIVTPLKIIGRGGYTGLRSTRTVLDLSPFL
jgi:hypothetical protein